jgi:hypothetical protein
MDETDSGSYQKAGFRISGVEFPCTNDRKLVNSARKYRGQE